MDGVSTRQRKSPSFTEYITAKRPSPRPTSADLSFKPLPTPRRDQFRPKARTRRNSQRTVGERLHISGDGIFDLVLIPVQFDLSRTTGDRGALDLRRTGCCDLLTGNKKDIDTACCGQSVVVSLLLVATVVWEARFLLDACNSFVGLLKLVRDRSGEGLWVFSSSFRVFLCSFPFSSISLCPSSSPSTRILLQACVSTLWGCDKSSSLFFVITFHFEHRSHLSHSAPGTTFGCFLNIPALT